MGYACPVCGHPQSDASHLANHLAFTALARGGDHEAWLDEYVPEWESLDETSLGERVVDHADPVEFPQVFADTAPGPDEAGAESAHDHDHDHDPAQAGDGRARGNGTRGSDDPRLDAARRAAEGAFSDDAADVLAEARELTRKRRENATRGADDGDTDADTEQSEDASAEQSETE